MRPRASRVSTFEKSGAGNLVARTPPFDLAAELHLAFDKVAVAYRRAMAAPGLG